MIPTPEKVKLNRAERRRFMRGAFTGPMDRPAILVSHAPGWRERALARAMGGQLYRSKMKRTLHRMRATTEGGVSA